MIKIRHRFPSYPGAIYCIYNPNRLINQYSKFYGNGSIGIVVKILSSIRNSP
jgi:hypothetical protein